MAGPIALELESATSQQAADDDRLKDVESQLTDVARRCIAAREDLDRAKAERGSLPPGDPGVAAADAALAGAAAAVEYAQCMVATHKAERVEAQQAAAVAAAKARVMAAALERGQRVAAMAPLVETAAASVADLTALFRQRWPGCPAADSRLLQGDKRAHAMQYVNHDSDASGERKALEQAAASLRKVAQYIDRKRSQLESLFPQT